MADRKHSLRGFARELLPHVVWDGIKEIARWLRAIVVSAMITTAIAAWQKIRHGAYDWYVLVGVFLGLSILLCILLYITRTRQKVSSASDFLQRQEAEEEFMRSVKGKMGAVELERRFKNEPGFTERVNAMPRIASFRHPRIYVEIKDEREGLYKKTPFILHNRGEQDAHNVHISVGEIRRGKIEIERDVPVIFSGKDARVIPVVQGSGIFGRENIIPLLVEEWNSYNDLSKETLTILMTATYCSHDKQWFESLMEIVFYPFTEVLTKEFAPDDKDTTVIEVRMIETRPKPS